MAPKLHPLAPLERYIEDDNGCWIWQGCVNAKGYGVVYDPAIKGSRLAHRFFYMHHVGPIPKAVLDHLCETRACVNPEHLEPTTSQENCRRSDNVSPLDWSKARSIRESTAPTTELAAQYGVHPNTIRGVRNGARWPAHEEPIEVRYGV